MIDIGSALGAFDILTGSWGPWTWVIPGLFLGVLFGAIPGLSPSVGLAIFLPATYGMDFLSAIIFLTAMFTGGSFGVAIPAILVNVPGSASAVATTFDGYPMTQKGQHNEALGLALSASTFGMMLGYVVLFLLLDPLAHFVIRMGPSEMFAIAVWGLSLIALLSGQNMLRGLVAGLVGLLLGTIGMNNLGNIRGTWGIPTLLDGIPVIPAMVGLFAAAEMFNLANRRSLIAQDRVPVLSFRLILRGWARAFAYPLILLRGSFVGVCVGAIPGVGASIANLMSYAETRRRAPDPKAFGKGDPRGVVAAESANSSSEGGSMATLFALGIPGGGGTAILLAAFAIHNVGSGPRFIANNKDIVYAIIFNNLVQGLLLLLVGLAMVHLAARIVRVPVRYIVPSVLALCFLGSYTTTGDMSGPITMVIFAGLGWAMTRYGYPVAAMVVGLLLGRMAEAELVRTLQISGGNLSYLLERPVTMLIVVLFVLSLVSPLLKRHLPRVPWRRPRAPT